MSTGTAAVSFTETGKRIPDDLGNLRLFLVKYTPRQGWDTFLLMLASVGLAAFSVSEADWVETPGMVSMVVWSSLVGLILAKVRLPWPILMPAGFALGVIPLSVLAATMTEGSTVFSRIGQAWDRIVGWYTAASSGGISTDLLPFSIGLLAMAWGLGFLSAWFLFRRSNVWVGLVIGGVALLTNLSFTSGGETRFFVFMLAALLLVARMGLSQREEGWKAANFDLSSNTWLSAQTTVYISVLILVAATLLPLNVYVWSKAVDVWDIGRSPISRIENDFARLFSGIASQKDLAGRYFGDTLPFQGKISFSGEVVIQAQSEFPSYWLSRTYSEYTSQGWISGEIREVPAGPDGPPPPPQETAKRVPVVQNVQVNFETDTLWVGGSVDWISHDAVALTLAPQAYTIDIRTAGKDEGLPQDIQSVAAELREILNPLRTDFAESEIARALPDDMTLVNVNPDAGYSDRKSINSVRIAYKEPAVPEVVGWQFSRTLQEDEVYSMRSYVSRASIEELKEAPTEYTGSIKSRYLQLPTSLPQRVRDLAAEVTNGAETPMDKALKLQEYLRGDSFEYSQDIDKPPLGEDGVDNFLFETGVGYSDYFASAMTVMLRAVGVPSRMAAGYAPGESQEGTPFRAVRDSDSHGWTQAYFPGHGWIDFEPTSAWPLASRGEGSGLSTLLADSLEVPEYLEESNVGIDDPCLGVDPSTELFTVTDEECIGEGSQLPGALDADETPAFVAAAGLIAAVLAFAAMVAALGWLIWTRGFSAVGSPVGAYAKMGRLGTLAGVGRRPYQTPSEYAVSIATAVPGVATGVLAVSSLFAANLYGKQEALTDEDVVELKRHWRAVRSGLFGRALRRLIPIGGSSRI